MGLTKKQAAIAYQKHLKQILGYLNLALERSSAIALMSSADFCLYTSYLAIANPCSHYTIYRLAIDCSDR
jgi:hypothetical protein